MIYMHLPADNPCGEALAALEILGFSSWSCSEAHVTLSLQSLETNQLKHGFIWNCSRRFILWQFSKGKWLKWWWLTTTNFRVTQCSNKHQSQWAFCSPWTCLLLMHFGSRSQPPGFIHRNGASIKQFLRIASLVGPLDFQMSLTCSTHCLDVFFALFKFLVSFFDLPG